MLVGVAVMILSMPLTAAIARYQTKLQRQQMKNKDSRTRIMSEILNNIRSIKLVRLIMLADIEIDLTRYP